MHDSVSHMICHVTPHISAASREEVDRVVKELKLKLFRTSVKENFNVDAGILGWGRPIGKWGCPMQ